MVAIVALLAAAGMTLPGGPSPAQPHHVTVTLGRHGSKTVADGTVRVPVTRHAYRGCLSDVDTPGRRYLPCRAIRFLPWRKLAGGPQRAG